MPKEKLNPLEVPEIPTGSELSRGQLLFITSNNVTYSTHLLHKYPAKFIPHVPRWAISKYLKGKNK